MNFPEGEVWESCEESVTRRFRDWRIASGSELLEESSFDAATSEGTSSMVVAEWRSVEEEEDADDDNGAALRGTKDDDAIVECSGGGANDSAYCRRNAADSAAV
mmetsp:Transcript_18500/g.38891  ORF Transcript_18500/g.38891 Transcript_18500/m.38891 type:complete len:104 (+) Transcript_18500:652-963(+)